MEPLSSLRKIETHYVPDLDVRQRLQDYAVGVFRTVVSRKGIKKCIKKGLITIDGSRGYTGDWIRGGEILELYQDCRSNKPNLELELAVLYEDNHLAIVHKPAGMLVSGNKRFTLENALPFNISKSTEQDTLLRPEPIHRLDYPTTGTLLIGKTTRAVIALNKMFEDKKIFKTYYAITTGQMKDGGAIDTPVDNKPSLSEYTVVASIPSERYEQLNLLKLTLHTGRRHQLRKHLLSIGHPIFGDSMYKLEGAPAQGRGLYLHAARLEFQHPITSEVVKVIAPLPKKFQKLFPDFDLFQKE